MDGARNFDLLVPGVRMLVVLHLLFEPCTFLQRPIRSTNVHEKLSQLLNDPVKNVIAELKENHAIFDNN